MDEAAFDYPIERLPLRRRIMKLVTSGDWMARILIESMLVVFSILAALGVNQLPPGNRQATPTQLAQGNEPRFIRSWA